MKNKSLFIAILSLSIAPLLGYTQERYTSDIPYECTPIKQGNSKPPVVRKISEKATQNQSNVFDTIDLDGDGALEKITYTVQAISKSQMKTTVTVQDSAGNETVIYTNVTETSMLDPIIVIAGVIVNGQSYVRIIEGKNAYSAFDISYQGRGKFSTCKLSNALSIRNDMAKFFMRNAQK